MSNLDNRKVHMQAPIEAGQIHPISLCGPFHPGQSTQVWACVDCKQCLKLKPKGGVR